MKRIEECRLDVIYLCPVAAVTLPAYWYLG